MKKIGMIHLLMMSLFTSPAISQEFDWQKLLINDAQAMHDELFISHPGVYDAQNPEFKRTLENGLVKVKARAKKVHDFNGYKWAMREYAAAFNDGHLSINFLSAPKTQIKWVGFLTKYENGKYLVSAKDENDKNVPPLGAQLISCDGKSADKIGYERQGKWRGLWMLEGQKNYWTPFVMADFGNPFLMSPNICKFELGGKIVKTKLNWREIGDEDWKKYQNIADATPKYEFAVKTLRGGYWLSFPDFDSYDEKTTQRIDDLLNEIKNKQTQIIGSDFVIIDLRGNHGGNSKYANEIAQTLWGEGANKAFFKVLGDEIFWRASLSNVEYLKTHNYSGDIADGMVQAIKENKPYFSFKIANMSDNKMSDKIIEPKAKIFVLTDGECFSACLMAVDLFKDLSAKQIGKTTGADTYYMDVRSFELPSKNASLSFAMNKITGRKRGINQPYVPDIKLQNINNEAAILSEIKSYLSMAK